MEDFSDDYVGGDDPSEPTRIPSKRRAQDIQLSRKTPASKEGSPQRRRMESKYWKSPNEARRYLGQTSKAPDMRMSRNPGNAQSGQDDDDSYDSEEYEESGRSAGEKCPEQCLHREGLPKNSMLRKFD
jgi:hypothetical protein